MYALGTLNLIHVFDFYLATMFLIGLYRRWQLYREAGGLVLAMPGRWPNLLRLMRSKYAYFLSWTTMLPAITALLLSVMHMIACRLLWPTADLTPLNLLKWWGFLPFVVLALTAMLSMDVYILIYVSRLDRVSVESQLDKAEYWLSNWKGRWLAKATFGFLDPHKMVNSEIDKAMQGMAGMLNRSLWVVTQQTGLRIIFGLTLWGTWAVHVYHT